MSERGPIFVLDRTGSMVKMEPMAYESENLLQRLIAEHPDVLHDASSGGGEPRRWLLVTREAAIPDTLDGNARFSVDHLLLDQDGVPTFVEVKRSSDTRIRREVVGQMLDYAANALLYWPAGTVQSMFEAACGRDGRDAATVLREFLGDVESVSFWDVVAANLSSRTVRLLFIADLIPIELQRIIEFLNDQLRFTDVLGVEVQQYRAPDETMAVLVPRVIGRTARAVDAKAPRSRSARQWDEAAFLEALADSGVDTAIATRMLDWAAAHQVTVTYGSGASTGTLRLQTLAEGRTATLGVLDTSGKYNCEPYALRAFMAFSDEATRAEIVNRLNAIPGVALPPKIATSSWAYIYPDALRRPGVLDAVLDVAAWVLGRLRGADSQGNSAS